MKPAFALSFSENGISLHHQSDGDWYCIGSVPLDAPDLNDRIQALRDQGFAIENDLSCRLVIPFDQVRLLSVEAEGLTPEALDEKIRALLAEATPYDLSELAYAVTPQGSATQIAAVAQQTLAEAQSFAEAHGFIPALFTVSTEDGDALTGPAVDLPMVTEIPAPPDPSAEAEEDPRIEAVDEPSVVEETDSSESDPEEQAAEADVPGAVTTFAQPIEENADPGTFRSQEADPVPASFSLPVGFDLKRYGIPVLAASVVMGMAVGALSLMWSEPEAPVEEITSKTSEIEVAEPLEEVATAPEAAPTPQPEEATNIPDSAPPPQPEEVTSIPEPAPEPNPEELASLPEATAEPEPEESPELSATDAAILEALQIEPEVVEDLGTEAEAPDDILPFTGTIPSPPDALAQPELPGPDQMVYASVARAELSQKTVPLPAADSLNTDLPLELAALPAPADQSFDLDERGLVSPSPEGTLTPEGILVFAGQPSKVPPEAPVRFETEPEAETAQPDPRLAGFRPKPRPDDIVEQFTLRQSNREQRLKLAGKRPKLRPKSIETKPEVDYTPTALAVVRVPRPKPRPAGLIVAAAQKPTAGSAALGSTANVTSNGDEPGSFQPKTVAPKIPSSASVARQATIDNAINLRKLNLIGVYGTPANRRALVRLPSGRYKKLKVGDRIDGGQVLAIGDSELRYQKRGKNLTLKLPRS